MLKYKYIKLNSTKLELKTIILFRNCTLTSNFNCNVNLSADFWFITNKLTFFMNNL